MHALDACSCLSMRMLFWAVRAAWPTVCYSHIDGSLQCLTALARRLLWACSSDFVPINFRFDVVSSHFFDKADCLTYSTRIFVLYSALILGSNNALKHDSLFFQCV
jgi:hypothetical protein